MATSTELFIPLVTAAATVGALHSLAPDHWVPIAAVGRAQRWTTRRTARVALVCGLGHVTVSVLLGLLALAFGVGLISSVGERMASVSGLLLVGFGVAYALWGLRGRLAGHLHGHHHHHYDHVHDPEKTTVRSLFLIYCADPCVAVIPILFAAAPLPIGYTLALVVVYEVSTVGAMVALSVLARAGANRFRGQWIEHYGHSAAGGSIALTGIAVAVLGW